MDCLLWLRFRLPSVNTVDFFNEISRQTPHTHTHTHITQQQFSRAVSGSSLLTRLHVSFPSAPVLYGTITEFCTAQSCPVMSASAQFEYLWCDNQKIKKPIKCTAPEYVDYLMSWVESQLNDETVFPLQLGTAFPKTFQSTVRVIFKRLFRVYAHIYHSHFQKIVSLGAEAHLNTCFKCVPREQKETTEGTPRIREFRARTAHRAWVMTALTVAFPPSLFSPALPPPSRSCARHFIYVGDRNERAVLGISALLFPAADSRSLLCVCYSLPLPCVSPCSSCPSSS